VLTNSGVEDCVAKPNSVCAEMNSF